MIELTASTTNIDSFESPVSKSAEAVSSVGIGIIDESMPFRNKPIRPYLIKNGSWIMALRSPRRPDTRSSSKSLLYTTLVSFMPSNAEPSFRNYCICSGL